MTSTAENIHASSVISSSEIRWQCRRGMLELDILLNNFVDRLTDETPLCLTAQQQKTLVSLLSYADQTLFDLLMGNTTSNDVDVNQIIKLIQSTSSN